LQHSSRRITEAGTDEAAVAAILVGSGANEPDILLIKRAKRDDDPWSGQMAFPGGRRDLDDADLVDTACRETFEETGIVVRETVVVGELDDIRPLGPGLPRIIVRPFVFLLDSMPEVITNHEVDLHLWVKLSDLLDVAGSATVTVNGMAISVPAYNIGPHVVWGLTERILKSFIDLCV
jgi:8-oxo-dGTP pyrophosphatase MutT (NUDIX family)